MKRALFIFSSLISYFCIYANISEYGLHIRSYPLSTPEFTSMPLENGLPIKMQGKEFTLSFDLWVRKDNVFGSVFRIITNNNENIDLIYGVGENDMRLPILRVGEEIYSIQKQVRLETWVNVTVTINSNNRQIRLQYDGERIDITYPKLKRTKSVRISFGFCPFDNFSLNDIASVNIKDISLKRNNQEIRFWKMAQHNGDICYDEISNKPAVGKNTQWIVDKHITWRKIYEQDFHAPPSIAFDSINGRFFFATDKEKLFIFHSNKNNNAIMEADTIIVKGGEYVANFPNQLIYIPSEQKLVSYNLDENIYSTFNFSLNTWEGGKAPKEEHDYWNNTVVYNPADTVLISFAGYGHYLYKNELLFSYPFHKNKQQVRQNLTTINPRYTPASVLAEEKLYIFGGRGCPSGRQELSASNYYDLYSVNLENKTVMTLWSMEGNPERGDFRPSENMIWDRENHCFYVFTSQLEGILMKIDTLQAAFEPMSLPIGINFDSQYIYFNLFFAPNQQKLFTAILLSQVSGESNLEIYEIDYPPFSIKSVKQKPPVERACHLLIFDFIKKSYYIPVFIFVGLIVLAILYYRTKKINKRKEKHILQSAKKISLPRYDDESNVQFYNFTQKSICLLGEFGIFDKKGNDISSLFSTNTKSLLIALIFHSTKESKGISGNKLIQMLWYDKSEEAAKNNRNVYLSKLRTILEKVGDIKIVNLNGFMKIQISDNTLCDYLEVMKISKEKDGQNLEKITELLLRGVLLPDTEAEWIDAFRNDFANTTIDLLLTILKSPHLTDSLKLKMADILFQYDFLSEEALFAKCSILYKQNKTGLAKIIYDNFCNTYKSSLGTNYQLSFIQVVDKNGL